MNPYCFIQIFRNQQWQTIAIVKCQQAVDYGWQTATYVTYEFTYAAENFDRTDAAALSWACPVRVNSTYQSTWPPFLLDLLPQGMGREHLLKFLGLAPHTEASGDWPLLLAGAANPIGNLRVFEAAEWLEAKSQGVQVQGYTRQEVIQQDFLDQLIADGVYTTGAMGVQGEWPKLLLTEAKDGLFYLDHALADADAKRHWLVKYHRGNSWRAQTLKNEAKYMRLAKFLGLRVHGELQYSGTALLIPRFDRSISEYGVERRAQESIAALCNRAGFGVVISHNDICRVLAQACTDPVAEIIEYLKRDIANIALGNKDNHTRNTAVTRNEHGEIRLTPLFDFAPTWLHPEGISRVTRWDQNDGGLPEWHSVTLQVEDATGLSAKRLQQALIDWLPQLQQLEEQMEIEQVDAELIELYRPNIQNVCQQIERLR